MPASDHPIPEQPHSHRRAHRRRWWRSLWFKIVLAVVAAGCIALLAAGVYLSHHAAPIVRQRIVETLSARFHSPVELDSVEISLLHPFLKKKVAGLQLPIEISGTKDDVHFGLDLGGKK